MRDWEGGFPPGGTVTGRGREGHWVQDFCLLIGVLVSWGYLVRENSSSYTLIIHVLFSPTINKKLQKT